MKHFFKKFTASLLCAVVAAVAAPSAVSAAPISVLPGNVLTDLTNALFGGSLGGFILDNVGLTGLSEQQGSFSLGSGIGIDSGLLLTTGAAAVAEGPNDGLESNIGSGSNYARLGSFNTDANVFVFTFKPSVDGKLVMRSVFASEECETGAPVADAFGLFVGGSAVAQGSVLACPFGNVNASGTGDIQYGNYTDVLITEIAVTAGNSYDIELAIVDEFDEKSDSALFLEARFERSPDNQVPEPASLAMAGLAFLLMTALRRRESYLS